MYRLPACFALRPAASFLGLASALSACDRGSAPPSPPPTDAPAAPAGAGDAPVRLEYLCGNRFIITNAQRYPVTVTYEVQGTEERGERSLRAAPDGDPAFSEVELTVSNDGALALFQGERLLAVRSNDQAPCEPAVGPSFSVAGSSSAGAWSDPFAWPIVPLHVHLLRNGKVLTWGKFGAPQVWNPATGGFAAVPSPAWLFCAGHSYLPDGRLLVAGGHISDDHGLPDATIFNPVSNSWSRAAPMRFGRWYPTSTTIGNGEIVTLAGRDQSGKNVLTPEVWTGSRWRALTGARLGLPYYPRTFLAPDGRVFYAGEQATTRYLNPAGSGSWTTVGRRKYGTRDYGAAVMYAPGKIIYVGGGRTTRTAETIDLNQASPTWQWTGSMAYPRRHLNATVLPTGEVLATGGSRGTSFNEPNLAVRVAEIWDPTSGAWTSLASNAVNRTYHSTSLLLPDGRVLHAGSGDAIQPTGEPAPDERNAELFSPPYLFRGGRPTISSAPSSATYGGTFFVGTPAPEAVTKVSLIALGSVTHAFDMTQRFTWLSFARASGGLNVVAPGSRNLAPPGFYLLFILNGSDVPSVGKIVQLK
ncbi:MAG: DUF1929 domain-containing protein [Gemmatimonadales bacterium]|nr:DUF1929 domain-containing protein [Gemmatimonadales bacterium]